MRALADNRAARVVCAVLFLSTLIAQSAARADTTTLTVDPLLSSLSLTGDIDGTIPLEEQLLGSLTAALTGSIDIDYFATGFNFLGSSIAPVANPGPFRPGNAPADFASQVTDFVGPNDAFAVIRNAIVNATSGFLNTDGAGDFDGTGVFFEFSAGTLDYEIENVTIDSSDLSFVGEFNAATPGNIVQAGANLTLTLPVNISAAFDTGFGVVANINLSGSIVATGPAPAVLTCDTIVDTTGQFEAGITSVGNLYCPDANIGLVRLADGYDAIQPGTPREAWGVSAGTDSGYADPMTNGVSNLVQNGSNFNANDATVSTLLDTGSGPLLQIDQSYDFVAPNILRIEVDVTNISGSSQDVLFSRNVDWDILPNQFTETTVVYPYSNPVIAGTFYGFENPDPLAPFGSFVGPAGGTFGPGDLGGGFLLDLGTLADGEAKKLFIYHALNERGQTEPQLAAQMFALGLDGLITGYGTNGEYVAALGVKVVPEPSSVVLALAGFAGAALMIRRRRNK